MNTKLKVFLVVIVGSVSLVGAQVCEVCVPSAGIGAAIGLSGPQNSESTEGQISESTELQNSLTGLGFSFQIADDPTATACDVYITYPGSSYMSSATALPWVQAGNGLVQISDHGPDLQANTFLNVGAGDPPQTVTVVDAGHPITAGVAGTWQTFGFWHYEIADDYIGWVTDPDPNLAQISGNDRGLSARAEGSGRVVYVGWNVYGSAATADDLTILRQAIEWSGNCSVPVELMGFSVE